LRAAGAQPAKLGLEKYKSGMHSSPISRSHKNYGVADLMDDFERETAGFTFKSSLY
jgi:hypothetical protein